MAARRMMDRPRVDLPLPDSPTSPSTSPRLMLKDTPSTAFTGSSCPEPGNQVRSWSTSISTSRCAVALARSPEGMAARSLRV